MSIYVGVPVYNGEKTLKNVINRIPDKLVDYLILVNDGSIDNTALVISDCANKFKFKFKKIVQLHHNKNRGYGAAQKTIYSNFLKISNKRDILVLLHADGQTLPEEISILLKKFSNTDAEIVLGSRALWYKTNKQNLSIKSRKMPYYKKIGDKILTFLQNKAFGMNLSTFTSGYRAFTKEALRKLDYERLNNSHAFDSEILVEAKLKNIKLKEVPVYPFYSDEVSNFSLLNYIRDVFKLIGFYNKSRHNNKKTIKHRSKI